MIKIELPFDIDDEAWMMYANRPLRVKVARVAYYKRRIRIGKPGARTEELTTATTYDVVAYDNPPQEHNGVPSENLFPTKAALLASL